MAAPYKFDRNGDPIEVTSNGQPDAAAGSAALRDRLLWYFARWELENGFRHGAGKLLVPAGWVPK